MRFFSFGCSKAITTPFSLPMSLVRALDLAGLPRLPGHGRRGLRFLPGDVRVQGAGNRRDAVLLWESHPRRGRALARHAAIRAPHSRSPRMVFLSALLAVPLLVFLVSGQNYSSRYGIFQLPIL